VAAAAVVVALLLTLVLVLGRGSSKDSDEPVEIGSAVSPTVAVLPFQNLGGDASLDYLGVAVTDEITTALSRVPDLTVRPSASTSVYRGQKVDPLVAGSELGVANVVTGQYFKEGDQLLLTLEAIDVGANSLVWRDNLTVPAGDLLSLREEVADRVRVGLLPRMGVSLDLGDQGTKPISAEAYDLYLQSLAISSDPSPNQRAMELLELAVELDPSYAPAWDELALRYTYHAHYAGGGEEYYRKSLEAANQAVSLDPDLVGAVRTLVIGQVDQGNLYGGFEAASRLVERRPDSGEALFTRSYVLRYAGLAEESAEDCRRALELDPGNPRLRSCAIANFQARRYDEAEQYLLLVAGSDFESDARMHMELYRDRFEVAQQVAREVSDDYVYRVEGELIAVCRQNPELTAESLARLDPFVAAERDSETIYAVAGVYAACRLPDRAFAQLRRAIKGNYCSTTVLETDASWDPYREDPEFLELRDLAIACRQRFLDYREQKRAG
jgi:TolB-like protein